LPSSSPHIADYWQVVARRLWLVVLIFGVTTASAIWAVAQQRTVYQTGSSIQINDPLDVVRQLTVQSLTGVGLFVDPIESEIQVLASAQVARRVVDELGMRVRPEDADLVRSQLFLDAWVDPAMPETPLQLAYDDAGVQARILDAAGRELAEGPVGMVLDIGMLRLTPQPPPDEDRSYGLVIRQTSDVQNEVLGRVGAEWVESTNIVSLSFRGPDPILAPRILNGATAALQGFGVEKVRDRAQLQLDFIEQRLDSAQTLLQASAREIRDFKETAEFTNLTTQEQQLINNFDRADLRIQAFIQQQDALQTLTVGLEASGVEGVDLVSFMAALPAGVNPQIRGIADNIQDRKNEVQILLTEDGFTEDHPRVGAIREQLATRESELRAAVAENLVVLGGQIRDEQDQLDQIRVDQANFPELENRLGELNIELGLDQDQVRFLRSEQYEAEITVAGASTYVIVIDSASAAFPVTPGGQTNLLLGAILGLILGLGAAFFLEYLDRTVRTSAEVEMLLSIPVLGIIPRLRKMPRESETEDDRTGLPLLVALDPIDPAAEAYRNLRMNLMFMSTEEKPIRTLLFSSPGPNEGKSTTSINVAVMLAQQKDRVLLIDADVRRPALHRAMDVLREPGLTNLLIGDAEIREAVRPNVLPNLDVLPSGPFPPNPSELLNSKKMQQLLRHFEGTYNHIIIDSPPILAVTDSAILAKHTDGMVLVLRSGETEQRAAERAVDQVRRVGVRVFGAVLNEVSSTTVEESYYMQYHYSYHPKEHARGWRKLAQALQKTS
jgi:tyrosine-protein kinase Etk/Wzc